MGVKDMKNEDNNMWLGVEFQTPVGDHDGEITLPDGTKGGFKVERGYASYFAPSGAKLITGEFSVKRISNLVEQNQLLKQNVKKLEEFITAEMPEGSLKAFYDKGF